MSAGTYNAVVQEWDKCGGASKASLAITVSGTATSSFPRSNHVFLVVEENHSYSQVIGNSSSAYLHRASAWLASSFGGLALLLSIVGLYGVISYSVNQRTREIGVRMALGAARGSVYGMVFKEAGKLTAIGIGAGLACSIAGATLMRKLLFGTQAWDMTTLAGVAVTLVTFALIASYVPARRAASVNPVEALRAE